MTPEQRFFLWEEKIEKQHDGCWKWVKGLSSSGYGRFSVDGRSIPAHKFGYEWFVGPVPKGLQLDHTCHDPDLCAGGVDCPHRKCVNPWHLEPVTCAENIRRGNTGKARVAAQRGITHCPQNHLYAGDNLYLDKNGHRFCRECMKAAGKRRTTKITEQRTHCPHNHEYTPDNTKITSDGKRRCRACIGRKTRERKALA